MIICINGNTINTDNMTLVLSTPNVNSRSIEYYVSDALIVVVGTPVRSVRSTDSDVVCFVAPAGTPEEVIFETVWCMAKNFQRSGVLPVAPDFRKGVLVDGIMRWDHGF